jgi:glycosyltransferase involved in cell wall biosynthesis
MPDVSVLLPCYNASKTLEETLLSLKDQSYPDFEVICVDDGSTDGTSNLLKAWCQDDPRFIHVPIDHGGVVSAANTGLEFCQGEIVVRMDADDLCHPDRIKLQREYLGKNTDITVVGSQVKGFPEDAVGEGFQLYYDWLNSLISHEDIIREIFVESPIANPSAAFRRSWIRELGGYRDHGWPEDYDLWLRFYLAGARFAKIPQVLLEWREHPERLTHQDSRYSVENFLRAKAHYFARGPARGRDAVFVWGAGMTGRRLSKHLVREGLPLAAFIEVDENKIGNTRRGKPIVGVPELMGLWAQYQNPILLTAVRARSAAPLIQAQLDELGLEEGQDWWRCA